MSAEGTPGREPNPAEGEPAVSRPSAGTDEDTAYDEGSGDRISPGENPEEDAAAPPGTHQLPADLPPGEIPER